MTSQPGRPFKPGQSGNPNGRPKVPEGVKDLARQFTELSVNTLAEICRKKKAPAAARVMAATALLDRAWGKPVQVNENRNLNVNLDSISDAELIGMLANADRAGDPQAQGDPPVLN